MWHLKTKNYLKNSDELIGIILHDISKPIMMLRSSMEVLKRPDLSKQKRDEIMERIDGLVEMANSQIRSFRMVYELSYRLFRSQKVKIKIDYLFKDIIDQVSNSAKQKSVIIKYNNSLAEDVDILVDPDQFSTAIINVLQNSMQYTEEHPKISISITKSNNLINIRIDDFGFGFGESDINHIFESGWSKGYGFGRGYGLWITKNLLQENNLDIQLISKKNPTSFLISGSLT